MADNPISDLSLEQNPAPFPETGQEHLDKMRTLIDEIMAEFMRVLPSNYVSQVTGPFYTLQFQAAAERLAEFQLTAQEVFKDSGYDYTRPEFLWEILGTLIFPEAPSQNSAPTMGGDVSYRTFLIRMVSLLLQGATPEAIEEGAGLLAGGSTVTIVEKFLGAQAGGSAWTIDDQFTFEVNVETDGGTAFPTVDPFVLEENVRLILQALRPSHTVYNYRYLFRETFGTLFTDNMTWQMSSHYYDDIRRYWQGTRRIEGTSGAVLTDRRLFSDPSRSFASVAVGGYLRILSGLNAGAYRISEVIAFPVTSDSVPRAYTTSPTGLTGSVVSSGGSILTDTSQDFGSAVEGEVLTIAAGPNAGTYRLDTLLGSNGGPVGQATGPATSVRTAPSILRLETRVPYTLTGLSYEVDVDRLGVREGITVSAEDVSSQFWL